MVRCDFHLEGHQNGVFFAGQVLKGQVSLVLDEPINIRSFNLIISGYSYCSWNETEYGHKHSRSVTYHGREVFLNSITYLLGSHGAAAQPLVSGTYQYEFQVRLPPNLPASFESSKGHIRYKIEAKLDLPWKFDKQFKLQFTVVRVDDLNMHPELRYPLVIEEINNFCCFCCSSDALRIKAYVPQAGFATGQIVPMKIEYFNKSGVEVVRTNVSLVRVVKLNSQTPQMKSKVLCETILSTICNGVGQNSSEDHDVKLILPEVMARSNERYSKVVQVFYVLKIEAVVTGCRRNVELTVPITVGSVPLGDPQQQRNQNFADPSPPYQEPVITKNPEIDVTQGSEQLNFSNQPTPSAPTF